MWISNLNIIPTVSNLPGQGSSGPAPSVFFIALESGLTDIVELEASTDLAELE